MIIGSVIFLQHHVHQCCGNERLIHSVHPKLTSAELILQAKITSETLVNLLFKVE